VIDAPTLLIERTPDQIHVPLLRSKLDELSRPYWAESAVGESTWSAYARAATFLAHAFRGTLQAPVAEPGESAAVALTHEELSAMIETPVAAFVEPADETVAATEDAFFQESGFAETPEGAIEEAPFEVVGEASEDEPVVADVAPAPVENHARPHIRADDI
jgi:hypothetical protein